VWTITLVIVGSAVVIGMVERFIDRRQRGQLIYLRENAIQLFLRSKNVLYGYVICYRERWSDRGKSA
jgi:hypothetical protein